MSPIPNSLSLAQSISFPSPKTSVPPEKKEENEIDKLTKQSNRTSSIRSPVGNEYIGKDEDDAWWEEVSPKQTEGEIYSILIENIGIFRWQNAQYVISLYLYICDTPV